MKRIHFTVLCFVLAFNTMFAQEKKENVEQLKEVVVTATKFELEKEKVGKIVYQFTSEDLEKMSGNSVLDVLDNVSSFSIRNVNGAAGQVKSTYIRGGRDRQVLVLIDGVPVSDPSQINTTFDLRLLSLSQVESIEVMNGAASTLYGTGAATGVINIQLKKAAKKNFALNYKASIETNNSQDDSDFNGDNLEQNLSMNGTLGKLNYLVSGNLTKSGGFSAASDANSVDSFTDDEYNAENAFVRLGYDFSENLSVSVLGNYDKNKYDFDAGAFADADVNQQNDIQRRLGLNTNYKYNKGNLKLNASYNKVDRTIEQFNSWTMATDIYEYTGKTYTADLVNNYKVSNEFQLITGISYTKQNNNTNTPWGTIDSDLSEYELIDPYVSAVYNTSFGLNFSAGARLNNHSEYNNHLVYNFNPSFNVNDNVKLLASYSTAFIAPSTYQLFSSYGNTELNPEEDLTIEGGFEYSTKSVDLSSVFFYREEENAIVLPDFVQYQNAEGVVFSRGIETQLTVNAIEDVVLRVGYTYTNKSEDIDYIPKNRITAALETTVLDRTFLSLNYKNTGERTYFDQWGTGSNIDLDAYSLLDFNVNYELIKDKLTVFGKVSNIFDEDYVETIGYTTRGRNFKLGLDLRF